MAAVKTVRPLVLLPSPFVSLVLNPVPNMLVERLHGKLRCYPV